MSREQRDRETVAVKMPENTQEIRMGGLQCFIYEIVCELGLDYKFALYFDGRLYQVKVVEPDLADLEGAYGALESHIFTDGKLCLSSETHAGLSTIEQAYGRSVIWATGFSFQRAGHSFDFQPPE